MHHHDWGFDEIERFEHRDIEQTVAHGGMGGDVGIVAILRGIGAGNEKRVDGMAVALFVAEGDAIGFGFVAQAVRRGSFRRKWRDRGDRLRQISC